MHPSEGFTPKQTEKRLDEQAILFEMEVKHERQPIDRNITLARYIEIWLRDIEPKKLALSTFTREEHDIERILPFLGHLKLTEFKPEIFRDFYEKMRLDKNKNTGKLLAEKTVEGIHAYLCGILSDAVEVGLKWRDINWRQRSIHIQRNIVKARALWWSACRIPRI